MTKADLTRRDFMRGAAVAGAALTSFNILGAEEKGKGKCVKIGLVGCGRRGNGALRNCLDAGKHLNLDIKIVALADVFMDRALDAGESYGVPKERCFAGFDAYKKLLETDVEVVFLATCPNFRPVHFAAAVESGKHVFLEKPVAVDPPGVRKILAVGEKAREKGLAVVAGMQRRHQSNYLKNQFAIAHGSIGKVVGGTVMWCMKRLWYKKRREGESDADYLIRNWINFVELSGDHIVEQHIHNIDVANWFIGRHPTTAIGFGGRARRKTGNQFDFFSVDYDYGENCHIHSMCRQVNGCYNRVGEYFIGTEGTSWGGGGMKPNKEKGIKIPEFSQHGDGQTQEHVDLFSSIIKGEPLNETNSAAEATLTAIMGRISAYTGQIVRWRDLAEDRKSKWYNLSLRPTAIDFEKGNIKAPASDAFPLPGRPA